MPYFPDVNVLHVHVSKTAGTSIESVLSTVSRKECFETAVNADGVRYADAQHMTCAQLIAAGLLSPDTIREAKIFVVVRDPLRRFISSFIYQRQMHKFAGWFPHNRNCLNSIDEYASVVWDRFQAGTIAEFPHERPQHLYLRSAPGLPVPLRMRLETLDQDWRAFAGPLGLPTQLPQENAARSSEKPQPSAESIAKIKAIYQVDYTECGY